VRHLEEQEYDDILSFSQVLQILSNTTMWERRPSINIRGMLISVTSMISNQQFSSILATSLSTGHNERKVANGVVGNILILVH